MSFLFYYYFFYILNWNFVLFLYKLLDITKSFVLLNQINKYFDLIKQDFVKT